MTVERRSLHVTEDLVRRYSRRGNFHSEHATSESLGLPGLVAQGTQVTGPAYGLLLDAWSEQFLAHGELDVRFVGMVLAGETVTASVSFGAAAGAPSSETRTHAHADATIEVVNETQGSTAVVGTASVGRD